MVDPHAENYYNTSPYAYVANNPIIFIDPDGKAIIPVNEAGNMAVQSYLNKFSKNVQERAFGLSVKSRSDGKGGSYSVYTSEHKGSIQSPDSFKKALGRRERKNMSDAEINEAYAFYVALSSEKNYHVEGWADEEAAFSYEVGTEGSKIVDNIPGFAPREVHNNKLLENDIFETDFDKVFDSNRTSSDSRNKFEGDFNFYVNYIKNPSDPDDKNTVGTIVIDTRNENWQDALIKAINAILNE